MTKAHQSQQSFVNLMFAGKVDEVQLFQFLYYTSALSHFVSALPAIGTISILSNVLLNAFQNLKAYLIFWSIPFVTNSILDYWYNDRTM